MIKVPCNLIMFNTLSARERKYLCGLPPVLKLIYVPSVTHSGTPVAMRTNIIRRTKGNSERLCSKLLILPKSVVFRVFCFKYIGPGVLNI